MEEEVELHNLPTGVYGFTVPWILNSDSSGVVGGTGEDRISLRPSPGGTAVMEIHKSIDGQNYLVCFLNKSSIEEVAANNSMKISDPLIEIIVSFTFHDDFPYSIAIPLQRIVNYKHRRVSKYENIADITLA